MPYQRFAPRPELAPFVQFIWFYQGEATAAGRERTLPTGEMGLIVSLRSESMRVYDRDDLRRYETRRGAIVLGASSQSGVIDRTAQADVAGVQFRMGGGFPFFGYPAGEFQDATVSLEDVWGRAARDLRERLLSAPDGPSRAALIEEALVAQARPIERHPAVGYAVREFHRAPAPPSVLDVTAEVGLSPKRFIQLFREQVGLPPKLFGRVRRFQGAVKSAFGRPDVDWAGIALDAGYYDQPHFVREFRDFSGMTPGSYLASQGRFLNHVPLDAGVPFDAAG